MVEILFCGLCAGILGGLLGIGGGVFIVPMLVCFFNFSQKLAQGTTIAAMIPPIGVFAALAYWKNGNIDIKTAGLISLGFLFGGWIGGELVSFVPEIFLKRCFALFLIAIAIKLLLNK